MFENAASAREFVLAEVARSFESPEVSLTDKFADLRADSASVLRLTAALQDEIDISIDIVDIFQVVAVEDLVTPLVDSASRKSGA
ncbi:phosphopantetheine-binding protein [Streptomyces sp. NPDC005408]|uniref:phosphopantetheine-binding protein n=1 Tax=Streptomyces sp. NPDC005408 TaxID=3155341 RepID=UPI0033BA28CE